MMSIERIQPNKQSLQNEATQESDTLSNIQQSTQTANNSYLDSEARVMLDRATGLMQSIVTEKMSDKILRKMPPDEYLHLLSLLDTIVNGSIDKQV